MQVCTYLCEFTHLRCIEAIFFGASDSNLWVMSSMALSLSGPFKRSSLDTWLGCRTPAHKHTCTRTVLRTDAPAQHMPAHRCDRIEVKQCRKLLTHVRRSTAPAIPGIGGFGGTAGADDAEPVLPLAGFSSASSWRPAPPPQTLSRSKDAKRPNKYVCACVKRLMGGSFGTEQCMYVERT